MGSVMSQQLAFNVLFLCSGNSARSIMAEAILQAAGKPRFNAYSAGSHPTGQIHPMALELLKRQHLPTDRLRSKSWEEFQDDSAPQFDFVFTLCDDATQNCPVWPGQPITAHWGLADPAAVLDPDARRRAFLHTFTVLQNRILLLVNLPLRQIDRMSMQQHVAEIGKMGE